MLCCSEGQPVHHHVETTCSVMLALLSEELRFFWPGALVRSLLLTGETNSLPQIEYSHRKARDHF